MIDELRNAAGADIVTGGDFSPFRVHGRTPAAVVSPWNAEQTAAIVRVCSENGWHVEPAGAGSWLDWGRPPQRADVVVSTERMAGVTHYEPADLTISVAAGTPLAEIAETVTADRQMLGFDPPARPGATVGAAIALASAGPLRLSVGTPRDQVLGLEVVTGDGRVVHLGGRVVKNVAGYDLVRLLVGSRGTLGIITAAHLRLRPAPDADITALFGATSPDILLGDVYAAAARTWPAALELISPAAAAVLGRERQWTLAVRSRGNAAFVDEARRRLESIQGNPAVLEASEAARFWDGLANLEARARVLLRFASLPNRLGALVATATAAAVDRDGHHDPGHALDDWFMAAHAGNGIVRLWRNDPIETEPGRVTSLVAAIEAARSNIGADNGTVTAPVFPAADGFDPLGQPAETRSLVAGLKNAFDPAAIMAPGRFAV